MESSNYLVPLRKAKIIYCEKCFVYSFFSLFWTKTRQLAEIRQYDTNWQLGHKVKRAAQ